MSISTFSFMFMFFGFFFLALPDVFFLTDIIFINKFEKYFLIFFLKCNYLSFIFFVYVTIYIIYLCFCDICMYVYVCI